MRYFIALLLLFTLVHCQSQPLEPVTDPADLGPHLETLLEAKKDFKTHLVRSGEGIESPEIPTGDDFNLIQYPAAGGKLAAYLTSDPENGKRHPALIWIVGGNTQEIGDVWSPQERDNDQSASAFRRAGIVMMFPSQRGGNDNPGKPEGFLGEVDDILAAADYLAKVPYVDPEQIYLGGHSTGGTLAMLVGESSDRFAAVFALGPVAMAWQYGGEMVYCDPDNEAEMRLRSPIYWMHCVKRPMYVIEGDQGNWHGSIEFMAAANTNPNLHFFRVDGHDHFTVIAPVAELLAQQIIDRKIKLTKKLLAELK